MLHRVSATAGRLAIALIVAAGSTAVHAAPAVAGDPAVLGSVTVTPSGGSVHDTPMLESATTSAACPAGYGSNVLLRVGPAGGPYSNIVKPASAGGYDRQPVTRWADRSMTAALGRAPADGDYRLVVECSGVGVGRHPGRFETAVVVDGDNWQVAPDGGSALSPAWWVAAALAAAVGVPAAFLLLRRRARPAAPGRPVPAASGAGARPGRRAGGTP